MATTEVRASSEHAETLSQSQIEAFYHDNFVASQVRDFSALAKPQPAGVVVDVGGGCGFFADGLRRATGCRCASSIPTRTRSAPVSPRVWTPHSTMRWRRTCAATRTWSASTDPAPPGRPRRGGNAGLAATGARCLAPARPSRVRQRVHLRLALRNAERAAHLRDHQQPGAVGPGIGAEPRGAFAARQYRACLGLLALVRRYGADRLEAACTRVMAIRKFGVRSKL